jgi:hypothetical protein
MDLSKIVHGYRGVNSKRLTLPLTTVWYQIPIPSEDIDLVLIFNENDADDLRVCLVDEASEDPNRIDNVAIDPGYFALTGRTETNGWAVISADVFIWVQPLATDQVVYWATFSKERIDTGLSRKWSTSLKNRKRGEASGK